MGKVGSLISAQRERDKGNTRRANEIQEKLTQRKADIESKVETDEIKSQMIPKGSQVDLPVTVGKGLGPLNQPDDSEAQQATKAMLGNRGLPTEAEKMQQEMQDLANVGPLPAEQSALDPFYDRIKNVANYDVEGNLMPASRLNAQMNTQRQLALGLEQTPQTIDYNFETGKELLDQIQNGRQQLSSYTQVADKGLQLTDTLNAELQVPLLNQTEEGKAFYDVAVEAQLIDPETQQFTRKFGNAIAMEAIEAFTREQTVRDKTVQEGGDLSLIPLDELNFDDPFEDSDVNDPIEPLMKGSKLDAEARRTNVFNGVIDKVMRNPNQIGQGVAAGFGSASSALTPAVKAYGDTVAWQALAGLGFVDKITEKGKTYYVMSETAENYYVGTRALINDINPMRMILPTLTPNVESTNISASNFLGFSKVGNASVKSQRSLNDNMQMFVVDMMGKMNNRILPSTLAIHAHQVNSVINYRLSSDNRIFLDRNEPLRNMIGKTEAKMVRNRDPETREETPMVPKQYDKFYSTHPLANAIGLGEDKWNKAYSNAIEVYGKDHFDAMDQADRVMRSQARQIAMNFEMAKRFSNTTFYLQGFYANSNGRYHYRQTVLNPQNLKPNRALIANAKRELIDVVKSDMSSEKMQNWMYNIGRAILPTRDLGLTKADNMGFNAVLNPTQKILSEGVKNAIYLEWVRKGKILNQMTKSNGAFPELYNANIDEVAQIMESISDPEEWGIVTTAYIDVFNFHNARENARGLKGTQKILADYPTAVVNRTDYVVPKTGDSARVDALERKLTEARQSEDRDMVAQVEADIFKELEGLKVPVNVSKGTTFESTVIAKPDGKQSGPTLQALQNGDTEIAKRTGFIYASEDNVIPFGDIRSLFFERFVKNSNSQFSSDPEKQQFWKDVSTMLTQSNNPDSIVKDISRTPLMEYVYGKYELFNQSHILKFLQGDFGKRIMRLAETSGIEGYKATSNDPAGYRELVKDFNIVIGASLNQTMDVGHQALLKDLGLAYAMMGGETGRFTGPLGDTVYLGSRMRVKTGQAISIPFERGRLGVDLTRSVTTGSARPSKRNRKFDDDTLKFAIADPLDHGKELANQMAVLPVQNLDAAIIANAIYRLNINRQDNPVWGLFIHDSIISDSAGTKAYMRAYNDSMAKLALPGSPDFWSISKSTNEAYYKTYQEWRKRIMKRNEDIKISGNDDNRYVAMYDYLQRLDSYENPVDEIKDLKRKVQRLGWSFDLPVQYLAPARVFGIYSEIVKFMNLKSGFEDWIERQAKASPRLMAQVNKNPANLG